ncbi:hypothetical protein CCM_03765 [Cordyceps militaris CM01]|uniref:Uncharacterized protein n=1 Tax=Cordyceps militaris (strain CM01) TaxID=983644 RepID=G3JGH5_CORMM|nr:uncharacterized protein CCM_03765 [Cordyceps militaris CM01]EGX92392.1 hypothetical protein CCM_03765 [Cordyceps militaris CM01]
MVPAIEESSIHQPDQQPFLIVSQAEAFLQFVYTIETLSINESVVLYWLVRSEKDASQFEPPHANTRQPLYLFYNSIPEDLHRHPAAAWLSFLGVGQTRKKWEPKDGNSRCLFGIMGCSVLQKPRDRSVEIKKEPRLASDEYVRVSGN